MRLRLIYSGELKASQQPDLRTGQPKQIVNKHQIRKAFHLQLKRFWEQDSFLNSARVHPNDYGVDTSISDYEKIWQPDTNKQVSLNKAVANKHQEYGYKFVPLARKDWKLHCKLQILLLRQDGVNSAVSAGDIDNRVKTIIDALTKPAHLNQLPANESPVEGEDPFYCLLEDDRLVTSLEIESDSLLDPNFPNNHAHVIVSVEIRPHTVNMFNLSFAS